MAETAFFMPTLTSNEAGSVTLEFVLPDTLTTWQFKALAHDKQIRSGTLFDTCVTSKDLMVEPMPPRFLREGDRIQVPVKVSNNRVDVSREQCSFLCLMPARMIALMH